ncbi:MAG: YbeD family protein [Gammaproteobacteria bacterium]
MDNESLIEFPSSFPIKALGRDEEKFRQLVIDLIAVHAEFDPDKDVRVQPSKKGNFISVTVTFTAENQIQLDTIYKSLHGHELVLMVF